MMRASRSPSPPEQSQVSSHSPFDLLPVFNPSSPVILKVAPSYNLPASASNTGKKRVPYSELEVNNLLAGLRRHGPGKWAEILADYTFNNRNSVDLKDKYRTMRRKNEIPLDILKDYNII